MSHPFGDLLTQFLHRKHGLSQAKLAEGILQPPVIISLMCKGQRLRAGQARERVLAIIAWLQREGVLTTQKEANALLAAAGMADLSAKHTDEERLLARLHHSHAGNETPLPAAIPTSTGSNLPVQLTRFIGRTGEVAEVRRLLSTTRLLTLTGSGGSGKTRLALEVAGTLAETVPDGVWLVEFAALTGSALVPQTVANTLHIRETPGQPVLATLTTVLRTSKRLLVLDNCEHLIDACARLAETLLRACADLRILATSREPLHILGETLYRVPSLALPEQNAILAVDEAQSYDAIHLFVDRATTIQPSFQVTEEVLPSIVAICRRLDGMPLAIELAASRVSMLSVAEIEARLQDRFHLITAGNRTALPRQQTLRASIDWSYDLLSVPEQVLLQRLAVFAGSWTLEDAEAVCGGEQVEQADIFDLLGRLVDKSLVTVEGGIPTSYRLLESIREYAKDKLRESGDADAVQRRHLAWYLNMAQEADVQLRGPKQFEWIRRLETEHDNLRQAIDWASEHDIEAGLQLEGNLTHFWYLRGYIREGSARLQALAARSTSASLASRAKALSGAGWLSTWAGDWEAAKRLAAEGRELAGQAGDAQGSLIALIVLGYMAAIAGDREQSFACYQETLRLARQHNEQWYAAYTCYWIGDAYYGLGDVSGAAACFEEGLALMRLLGDSIGASWFRLTLAQLALYEGDLDKARALMEEDRIVQQAVGGAAHLGITLNILGRVVLAQGDRTYAHTLFTQSMKLQRIANFTGGIIAVLESFAGFAARHHPLKAIRLLGAAETLRMARGGRGKSMAYAELPFIEQAKATARRQVDAAAFDAAWAEGAAMTLDQAVEYALQPEEEGE